MLLVKSTRLRQFLLCASFVFCVKSLALCNGFLFTLESLFLPRFLFRFFFIVDYNTLTKGVNAIAHKHSRSNINKRRVSKSCGAGGGGEFYMDLMCDVLGTVKLCVAALL